MPLSRSILNDFPDVYTVLDCPACGAVYHVTLNERTYLVRDAAGAVWHEAAAWPFCVRPDCSKDLRPVAYGVEASNGDKLTFHRRRMSGEN